MLANCNVRAALSQPDSSSRQSESEQFTRGREKEKLLGEGNYHKDAENDRWDLANIKIRLFC